MWSPADSSELPESDSDQNREAVPVGSQSCPQIVVYQSGIALSVDNESKKVNQSDVRPDASLVRTDGVLSDRPDLTLSVRPDSDPRSRPSALVTSKLIPIWFLARSTFLLFKI